MVLPIALPLLAGVLCRFAPRRTCAALAVLATALTVAFVWPLFRLGEGHLEVGSWLALRIDGLSAFVVLAVAAFSLLVALYSVGYLRDRERYREHFAYLLWTLGLSNAVVLANDLLMLLACWGVLGLTLYQMINLAGPDAADAARKSFMIVGGSDALLLLGVVLVWTLTGTTRMDAGTVPGEGFAAQAAFLCFVASAFAKAGAVPLHAWVPDCGEKATVPVAALLPASLDKLLGIYLLARCVLDLFEIGPSMRTLLMLLGAITVIAAVLMALVQRDLKRLLACHAVSQVGYMVLGIASGTAVGIAGGLFHMLNHAIYKSGLFLCAGAVEQAAGTTDLGRLGGLARKMPVTFVVCTVAALSISGIPPLNGFASKWMIYQGLIASAEASGPWWVLWLTAAMLGSALTLASFVKVLHATFLCEPAPGIAARPIREARASMLVPLVVLGALCVIFGVFARALPLEWLIFPAVEGRPTGVWWSGLATVFLLVAIGAGALVYALTMSAGRLRRVHTYVGGEHLDEVYIRGEASGPARHVAVTGVDFYRTFEQLPVLGRLYALGGQRLLDFYDLAERALVYLVGVLRGSHTGVLPLYLTWFLAGLVVVLWATSVTGGSR